jgi:hypothetical protein
MYTSSSIEPFKKEVFTPIWNKGQPKTYATNMMALIEVHLAIATKVSS